MNIFKPFDDSSLKTGLEQVQNRIDKLFEQSGQYAKLAAEVAGLRQQWEQERLVMNDLYDKAYHMLQRHSKRVRDAEKETPEETLISADPTSDRVLSRRKGNNGLSPVLPR